MAEDLGQDVGEYLLNQRSDILRLACSFIERVRGSRSDAPASASKQGEDVAALDFETPTAAAKVSQMLTELGFENHVVAASVYMMERDLPEAARQCSAIAEAAKGRGEPAPEAQAKEADASEPASSAPDAAKESAIPPATEKQRAFIEKLHAEGHIPDKALPDDMEELNVRDASALIKEGVFCRDMKADAEKDPVRVKEEGAQMRKASEKLVSERAGRDHEKVIDRGMAH